MKKGLLLIWLVLMPGFLPAAESDASMRETFGLRRAVMEGATVYYEDCFEGKLDIFRNEYQQYKQRFLTKDIERFATEKDSLYKEIETLLGPGEALKETFERSTSQVIDMAEAVSGLLVNEPTFYLMRQGTIKDYLRKGGRLPNFSYDPESDTAEYHIGLTVEKGREAEKQELTVPLSSPEALEGGVRKIFQMLVDAQKTFSLEIGIHEVSEMCLAVRLGSADPYIRWLWEGAADVVTYEMIRKHFSEEEASQFLKNRSVEEYQGIEPVVNLQYWMLLRYSFGNQVPIEKEKNLMDARYRFAFYEAKRLTDQHGPECIKKIIEAFTASESRTADELYQAIKAVTGEDLKERFGQYQIFKSKDEGMSLYVQQFKQAREEKKGEDMLFSLFRMWELFESPLHPQGWQVRRSISTMLYQMGYADMANQAMQQFVDYVADIKVPDALIDAKRNYMTYTIETGQYGLGCGYAQEVLNDKPDEDVSLMLLMLKASHDKNYDDAKVYAEKLCRVITDVNHPHYQAAKQILSEIEK